MFYALLLLHFRRIKNLLFLSKSGARYTAPHSVEIFSLLLDLVLCHIVLINNYPRSPGPTLGCSSDLSDLVVARYLKVHSSLDLSTLVKDFKHVQHSLTGKS